MEILDVVNEKDEVVGSATKDEVYSRELLHRIAHVIIMNEKGEMALQLRSKTKSYLPHHWCTTAGGHVQSGESYIEAARRELKEETGIDSQNLSFIRKDLFKVGGNYVNLRKFLATFIAKHAGPVGADGVEVEKVEFFSLDAIRGMLAAGEKFHPELLMLLREQYGIGNV